jgi:fructose 5-dehydrogenase small subunit
MTQSSEPRVPAGGDGSPSLDKRRFLLQTGVAAGTLLGAGGWIAAIAASGNAVAATGPVAASVPVTGGGAPTAVPADTQFLTLSQTLTGRSPLDPILARRYLNALSAQDTNFGTQFIALLKFVALSPETGPEVLAATLDRQNADLGKVLHRIVSAWYTGVVGEGANAQVIAYQGALMFVAVEDVVMPPSYCRAAPFYWTAKPPQVTAHSIPA